MPDIAALVHSLGGMAQKQQLVKLGARDLDLTSAVKRGEVIRARQGWYTTLPERDPRVRAVRVGGRLTGISAIIAAGGWVLRSDHPLHVSLPANAARLRSQWNRFRRRGASQQGGVVLHWDDDEVAGRGTATTVGLADALYRVVLDEDLETAVAALDWSLRTGALDRIDFERLMLRLPANLRWIAGWVDEMCDSLPESLSRTRFRLRGHHVSSQTPVGDLEHIDLVIDGCIGYEADGEEFHRDRFIQDRSKDLSITIEQLHAIRPSAYAIFHEWDRVLLAVETAIAGRRPELVFGNSGVAPRFPRRRRKKWPNPSQAGGAFPEFPKARRAPRE